MIVRTWQATASADNAPRYRAHLEGSVFPQLRALDGFSGAELMQSDEGDLVGIMVVTRWRDMAAVRAFAGEQPGLAVVEPAAQAVLADYARTVNHFEVVTELRP